MSRISLVLMQCSLTLFVSAPLVAQDTDPTASDVLRDYIQAIGGEESLQSVATMKLISKNLFHAESGDQERTTESTETVLWSLKKSRTISSLGTENGFDGSNFWRKNKKGEPVKSAPNRYPYDPHDPVSYPLHLLEFPGTFHFAGKTEIEGRPAYRLRVDPEFAEPKDRIRMTPKEMVFDAETGLLVKIVHEHKVIEFHDYREVDGIKVAFQHVTTFSLEDTYAKNRLTIDSIKFNIKLDDEVFSFGAEVGD